MKHTLFLEDENGNKINFNSDPATVKLIAENIDFDTMEGLIKEYLPKTISEKLFNTLGSWRNYKTDLMKLGEAK